MPDDELVDYKTYVTYPPIHNGVDVEDEANLSCSMDNFRSAMNDFVELKNLVL